MNKEKIRIKNKKGLEIMVQLEKSANQKGLAFLMHGHGSVKEHPIMEESARLLSEMDITVVRFDATNSILSESEGRLEEGTVTGYLEDLYDVINWAKLQDWYQEPFLLVGHSLGGYCVANYAANNPKEVSGLILFSPVVSGKLFQETDEIAPILKDWQETGMRVWESKSRQGLVMHVKYNFIKDALSHDALVFAKNIQSPILVLAGEKDPTVPVEYQRLLFDKITSEKEMHIFKDADHNLAGKEKSQELHDIINNWVRDLNEKS